MMPCSPPMTFCSIVGHASRHTAGPSGPSTIARSNCWTAFLAVSGIPGQRRRGTTEQAITYVILVAGGWQLAAGRSSDSWRGQGPERNWKLETGNWERETATRRRAEREFGPARVALLRRGGVARRVEEEIARAVRIRLRGDLDIEVQDARRGRVVRRPLRQARSVRIAGLREVGPVGHHLVRQPSIGVGPRDLRHAVEL